MPAQPTFGPRVGSYHVEAAVLTVLRERLPTYVDASARLLGIDPEADGLAIRPPPGSLCRRASFAGFPRASLPLVEVVAGEAGPAEKGAGGLLVQVWAVNVVVYVVARDFEATRRVRAAWELAIPWCIMQRQTLGGLAIAVDLIGEGADDNVGGNDDAQRTLQGAEAMFAVTVPNVLDPLAGPAVFIPDPGSGDPAEYDPPVTPEKCDDRTGADVTAAHSHVFVGPHPEVLADGTPIARGALATPEPAAPHDAAIIARGWLITREAHAEATATDPAEPDKSKRRTPSDEEKS